MSEHKELDSRVGELEKLVKKQSAQIEGLKQSIHILINTFASELGLEEDESTMGPQMPDIPGLDFNN